MIDWKPVQKNLNVISDGIPGRRTYMAFFQKLGPSADPAICLSLGNAAAIHFPEYGADLNKDRLADFMAQTANETGGFTRFEENLRYSAKRLMQVWPSRFPTLASALPFAWDPNDPDREDIALANKTYGGRMGNESDGTSDNDGWDYRGRGMLQLTGKGNYQATDRRLGIGLEHNPDIAAVPALSLIIALDFYTHNKVWEVLDRGDTRQARKITNGADIGLDHVNVLRKKALEILS